jgi:hypothetical protein
MLNILHSSFYDNVTYFNDIFYGRVNYNIVNFDDEKNINVKYIPFNSIKPNVELNINNSDVGFKNFIENKVLGEDYNKINFNCKDIIGTVKQENNFKTGGEYLKNISLKDPKDR